MRVVLVLVEDDREAVVRHDGDHGGKRQWRMYGDLQTASASIESALHGPGRWIILGVKGDAESVLSQCHSETDREHTVALSEPAREPKFVC